MRRRHLSDIGGLPKPLSSPSRPTSLKMLSSVMAMTSTEGTDHLLSILPPLLAYNLRPRHLHRRLVPSWQGLGLVP